MLPRIVGVGVTPLTLTGAGAAAGAAGGAAGGAAAAAAAPLQLMLDALRLALADAGAGAPAGGGVALSDVDGLIALPSLMGEHHFMAAHAVAGAAGLFAARRGRRVAVRTLDVGGAGPVAALLMAARMVSHEGCESVAVVAGDAAGSAPLEGFLARADAACGAAPAAPPPPAGGGGSPGSEGRGAEGWRGGGGGCGGGGGVPSPVIPNLYDRVARWQMARHGVTREQLAMVASLMTLQAARHPLAARRRPRTLEEVAPVTTALECAKRADGAAALLVVSPAFAARRGLPESRAIEVLGGGEASGPLSPPPAIGDDTYLSAAQAAALAYAAAGLPGAREGGAGGIDYFSLYDCFPVCFIRQVPSALAVWMALEAVGLAPEGGGGRYVERAYHRAARAAPAAAPGGGGGGGGGGGLSPLDPRAFPINTHGGLLGLGAPWEVPAMHGVAEAAAQLRGEAAGRQVAGAARALVYGNGGVLSASAVAILGRCGGGGGGVSSRL
ncbi:MAG: hypothetical protein J3K34DRAFT_465607 [Monoraphidium minutum]|nr:MAG: hypothetical protein J3K34DRAFT_465607 [Monoraphidium minutum]